MSSLIQVASLVRKAFPKAVALAKASLGIVPSLPKTGAELDEVDAQRGGRLSSLKPACSIRAA